MTRRVIGFVIWSVVGCLFIGLGIYSFYSQKPMGFWANAQMFEVTDRKKYNAAVGKLFSVFGIVFILLGLPLLAGQNSPWIFLSVIGALMECIIAMVVYTVVIEEKYRKRNTRNRQADKFEGSRKISYYERTLKEKIPYDPKKQYAVMHVSICTGEKVAGFKNYDDSHFTEVMLIRNAEDEKRFKAIYGLDEIKKEY